MAAIRQWWLQFGKKCYSKAKHLLIEADAGGCNGYRPRLWKWELQQFANEIGLSITVVHYPSGASKWNPIEHRLFSQVSRNWAGSPLRSLEVMLKFLCGTTTSKGLIVDAQLDSQTYEKGIKISDSQMRSLKIKRRRLCPNLNYTIIPTKSVSN